MNLFKVILLIAGVMLMAWAFIPSGGTADVLDMGGCAGKDYPCVPVTIYGTVHWTGRQEVTSIIVNVDLPSGMGYSNAVYTDGNGNYQVVGIPCWDEIAAPWHHYEGTVNVIVGGNNVGNGQYWRTISGGVTTHSDNWVSGDTYRLDFTVVTEGQPSDQPINDDTNQPQNTVTNIFTSTDQPKWGFFVIGLVLFMLALLWRS